MPRKGDPPVWAFELLKAECERAGRPTPALMWTRNEQKVYDPSQGRIERRLSKSSSGWTNPTSGIRIRAGSDKTDARMLVLHEAAHWIVGPGHHHDRVFWDKAFELYRRYRLGLYAIRREASYKAGAIDAAYRAGILDRWEYKLLAKLRSAAENATTGRYAAQIAFRNALAELKKAPLRNAR